MHLDLTLVDKTHERVEVEEGRSLSQELEEFLAKTGRDASGWVPVRWGEMYIRYEQVARVSPVGEPSEPRPEELPAPG